MSLLVAAVLAGSGWGIYRWLVADGTRPDDITATAKRTTLAITVTERGELESSKTVNVRCEVEGTQIKIVSILPEGVRVKKGDVVLTFDSDQLKHTHGDQLVKCKTAEGKSKVAKGELEVARNKAEDDIEKAARELILAELDLKKYVEGDYVVDVHDKEEALELAKKELQEAEEKLEHYRKLEKKGFIPPEQRRLKEAEVAQKDYAVRRDRAKLMVLQTFTKQRQEVEFKAKARDAARALDRARKTGTASVEKAQSDYEAAEVTARLEKATLDRLQRQLDGCVVKAPQEGILVYSRDRWYDDASRIQAGAMVFFRQGLFTLPDLTQMQIKVKIHEAMIKKVKQGQTAEIRLDAYPAKVLHGKVESVGTLASQEGWFDRFVKEYVTIVTITDLPQDAGLKPGMTGEVKILVNTLPDVLAVPVQSVGQVEGQHYCYVVGRNGIDKRAITVGENNDKFVSVQEGLEEGEKVVLDARARLAAETKVRERKGDVLPKPVTQETKPSSAPPPPMPR